jgi:hypothetical protein
MYVKCISALWCCGPANPSYPSVAAARQQPYPTCTHLTRVGPASIASWSLWGMEHICLALRTKHTSQPACNSAQKLAGGMLAVQDPRSPGQRKSKPCSGGKRRSRPAGPSQILYIQMEFCPRTLAQVTATDALGVFYLCVSRLLEAAHLCGPHAYFKL